MALESDGALPDVTVKILETEHAFAVLMLFGRGVKASAAFVRQACG